MKSRDLRARLVVRQAAARAVVGTPKSGKTREVDLCDEARDALKAHRHLRGPLVFCDEGGAMLSREILKRPLWAACKRAGLEPFGWHVLRHTFGTNLAKAGVGIAEIRDLMGHTSVEMTMRYVHAIESRKQEAVEKLLV